MPFPIAKYTVFQLLLNDTIDCVLDDAIDPVTDSNLMPDIPAIASVGRKRSRDFSLLHIFTVS